MKSNSSSPVPSPRTSVYKIHVLVSVTALAGVVTLSSIYTHFNSHISVFVCSFFEFGTVSKWRNLALSPKGTSPQNKPVDETSPSVSYMEKTGIFLSKKKKFLTTLFSIALHHTFPLEKKEQCS